nr:RNA-directed DNA polymerase, eukaryota, reverse transcriptase zinc-binding domain protein [Tanacetum cinerariifolium]
MGTRSNFSGDIGGLKILDGPFILNELLAWCKRNKKQAMIFKVDFAKAYDLVRWDYLLDVLHAFGFGLNWCRWIRGTFSSTMASILVHGSPTSEFPFFCGLKQGDLLAPFLFILVMESLHISFSRTINDGVLKALINGRLTLLKSVLSAFPLYNMSIYKVPKGVLNEMKVIGSKFFIGADSLERKITWVSWDKVLASKKWWSWCVKFSCVESSSSIKMEMDKEISVASKLGFTSLEVSFRRPVRDGVERQQLIDLNLLTGSILLFSSKDRWICDLSGDGEFRVKVARTKLDDVFLPYDSIDKRWVKYIPIKINVFA